MYAAYHDIPHQQEVEELSIVDLEVYCTDF